MNQAVLHALPQGNLAAPAAWVIIGDDQFPVFLPFLVGHGVVAAGTEDVKVPVQFPDKGAVVVGEHHIALGFPQYPVETQMVFPGEVHIVDLLRLHI